MNYVNTVTRQQTAHPSTFQEALEHSRGNCCSFLIRPEHLQGNSITPNVKILQRNPNTKWPMSSASRKIQCDWWSLCNSTAWSKKETQAESQTGWLSIMAPHWFSQMQSLRFCILPWRTVKQDLRITGEGKLANEPGRPNSWNLF